MDRAVRVNRPYLRAPSEDGATRAADSATFRQQFGRRWNFECLCSLQGFRELRSATSVEK
jgi:hypothetical protein